MNLMNTVFKRTDVEEFGICGLHMKDVQTIKVMQIFCGPEKKILNLLLWGALRQSHYETSPGWLGTKS